MSASAKPVVAIVGAGFAGMAALRALRGVDASIVIVDQQNHHLFQPLLFQVATAILADKDVASPIRSLVRGQAQTRVVLAGVNSIDRQNRQLLLDDGKTVAYDFLILATGSETSYFGKEHWQNHAPGLKTLSDAQSIRNQLLETLEKAEAEPDADRRRTMSTFVVIGGGPTGVAITGSISELVRQTLRQDFRNLDPRAARLILVQAGDRLLPAFPAEHSDYALRSLRDEGVEVMLGARVTDVDAHGLVIDGKTRIDAGMMLWCAGVRGGDVLKSLGTELDRTGRVPVDQDFLIHGTADCYAVGDAACFTTPDGRTLPGLAEIAARGGEHAARVIAARIANRPMPAAFTVPAPDQLATIVRHKGVADIRGRRFTGYWAWLLWGLLHLLSLSEAHARRSVLASWAQMLARYRRDGRLIIRPPR